MNRLRFPGRQRFQAFVGFFEHHRRVFKVGLALFVDKEVFVVLRKRREEIEHFRNLRQPGDALLENVGEFLIGHVPVAEQLLIIRHGDGGKFLRGHILDILAVEPAELVVVKDGRRFADTGDVKRRLQLLQGEKLLIILGAPAQQGDIVDNRLRQIAVVNQIVEAGRAVTLAQLGHVAFLVLAHNQRQVNVGRNLPAEGFIEQVVFRRGAEVLGAADNVRNAHGVVVNDVGEVVGRVAVGLNQNLILQLAVLDGNLAEHRVGEGRAALSGHFLTDNVGRSLGEQAVNLLLRQIAAVTVIAAADGFVLDFFQPFLGAEAAVSLALGNQLFRVGKIHILALGLHIGTEVAADVGTFVVLQTGEL